VYDATPFLADHPGGAESILISAGMDATDEFNGIHSAKAKGMLADYYIGELATAEQVRAGSNPRGGGRVLLFLFGFPPHSRAWAVQRNAPPALS
jgi:nitrate reductase (NAD(P)H)